VDAGAGRSLGRSRSVAGDGDDDGTDEAGVIKKVEWGGLRQDDCAYGCNLVFVREAEVALARVEGDARWVRYMA
jgi:hypothetical protein